MDTYELVMKDGTPSSFVVKRKAGTLNDQAALLVNGRKAVVWKAGSLQLKGSQPFQFQDKELTLRWQWSEVTGKPKSIQIFDTETLIASFPANAPVITPRNRWHYATRGFSLASLMTIGLAIGLGERLNLQNNLGFGLLVLIVCVVLFTGVGVALDLIFRRKKA